MKNFRDTISSLGTTLSSMYDMISLHKAMSDVGGIHNLIAHFAACSLHWISSHASSTEHIERAMTCLLPRHIIISHTDAKEVLVRSVPLAQLRSRLVHTAVEHKIDDLSYPF